MSYFKWWSDIWLWLVNITFFLLQMQIQYCTVCITKQSLFYIHFYSITGITLSKNKIKIKRANCVCPRRKYSIEKSMNFVSDSKKFLSQIFYICIVWSIEFWHCNHWIFSNSNKIFFCIRGTTLNRIKMSLKCSMYKYFTCFSNTYFRSVFCFLTVSTEQKKKKSVWNPKKLRT